MLRERPQNEASRPIAKQFLELLVLSVLALAGGTLFLGLLHLELNLISFFLFLEAELIPEIV
jgi:hypothetical protein